MKRFLVQDGFGHSERFASRRHIYNAVKWDNNGLFSFCLWNSHFDNSDSLFPFQVPISVEL